MVPCSNVYFMIFMLNIHMSCLYCDGYTGYIYLLFLLYGQNKGFWGVLGIWLYPCMLYCPWCHICMMWFALFDLNKNKLKKKKNNWLIIHNHITETFCVSFCQKKPEEICQWPGIYKPCSIELQYKTKPCICINQLREILLFLFVPVDREVYILLNVVQNAYKSK